MPDGVGNQFLGCFPLCKLFGHPLRLLGLVLLDDLQCRHTLSHSLVSLVPLLLGKRILQLLYLGELALPLHLEIVLLLLASLLKHGITSVSLSHGLRLEGGLLFGLLVQLFLGLL